MDYKQNLYSLLDGVEIQADKIYFCGVNDYKAAFVSMCNGFEVYKLGREYVAQKILPGTIIHYVVEPELDSFGRVVCYSLKDVMK